MIQTYPKFSLFENSLQMHLESDFQSVHQTHNLLINGLMCENVTPARPMMKVT